jgi:hypothetical protein
MIIDKMQLGYPQIFTPRAIYDGKANLYCQQQLNLPNGNQGTVCLNLFKDGCHLTRR